MERLKKVADITPVHSSKVNSSPIGLGFEKLDRDVFDPEKAYNKVAELGVKWIRIQSGWARTEKKKGEYDFAWLDSIVDNLLQRGLVPWICLCYGNGLYNDMAKEVFGAVGCVPQTSEEEKQAWHNYVVAVTTRYREKVRWYEVWNEPDGVWCWKTGPDGKEYGEFVKATVKAIKEGDINAKIIGGSTCLRKLDWLNDMFETGAAKYMDALTYHAYTPDENGKYNRTRALRSLCKKYNPEMVLIQGETGCQSRSDGNGALKGAALTPERQAKSLARHMMADLFDNVMFASYFSCMDMVEALNGKVGDVNSYLDYGYFGVLGADFDNNGFATGEYSPKLSYRTLQTIAAIFREDFELTELPIDFAMDRHIGFDSPRLLRHEDRDHSVVSGGFTRPDGSAAFVYWKPTELLTTTYEATISLEVASLHSEIRLINLLDGSVYELPEEMVEDNGKGYKILKSIPLLDSPLALTFGNFVL